jgi:hypothetical protein
MEHLKEETLAELHQLGEAAKENADRIDARLNPDAANRAVAEALRPSETPMIDLPPDCSTTLPGGYIHPADGRLYVDADVRELTGADEEALAKPEVTKSLGRFTQLLLQRGVTRIGPFENPNNNLLGSLLVGDRETLLIAIRQATYGTNLEMSVDCPACVEKLDLQYDISKDIPIKPMEDPFNRSFIYTTKDGRDIIANLAVGTDQEFILNASNKSVPELNTLLLSRCLFDKAGVPLGIEGVRALGISDRRELLKQITDRQPGPNYHSLDVDCPVCAKNFPISLTLYDLFR